MLSLIWFPFFFVAVFSLILVAAYVNPLPHHLSISVVGSDAQASQVRQALNAVRDGGFDVSAVASVSDARKAVADGDIDAAFVTGAKPELIVATGASGSRAKYLTHVFDRMSQARDGIQPAVIDVAPTASGDPNGNALMFLGLPLLLVGMIAAIVLMQFGGWSLAGKVITIAVVGAFGSVFTYLVALAENVIPNNEWVLLYAFMLTQAIGWLGLGCAAFVRQYFLPVLMTFVLILGIPSAGATVPADMSPAFIRWLNSFLPFAQFIDATRDSTYLNSSNLPVPIIVLAAWDVAGAVLIGASFLLMRRRARAAELAEEAEAATAASEPDGYGEVRGLVVSTTGRPILGATLTALGATGSEVARTHATEDGLYQLTVPFGPHHLVVTAPHCEPQILQIAVHPGRPALRHDIALIDWSDASGNLLNDPIPAIAEARHHSHRAGN
ncbi:MAG: ABC transporter permease [Actinomycetales bacterium]